MTYFISNQPVYNQYIIFTINNMKRRDFFKKSTMVSTGFAIGGKGFSIRSYASIIGASDRINLAVIGIRN